MDFVAVAFGISNKEACRKLIELAGVLTQPNERTSLGNFVRSGRALFSFPYPYGIVLKLKLARKLAEIGKCLLTGAFSAT